MNENKKVLNASLWYMMSYFLLKGMAFFTTPIFSRILTKEEFGYFNNFNAWLGIFTIVVTLSLTSCMSRARFDYEKELNSYIKSTLVLGSLFTMLCLLIFFAGENFFKEICVLEKDYFIIIFAYLIVSPAYDIYMQMERFNYRYKAVTIITTTISILTVVVSLVLVWKCENKLWGRTLGSLIIPIIFSFAVYLKYMFSSAAVKASHWKYMIKISVPYIVHLLSSTILNSSDRTMISKISGTESTAMYGMASNVAIIAYMLWSAMNQAFVPWLTEKLAEGKKEIIKAFTYKYILIYAFGIVGIMLLTPEIIMILGGYQYVDAMYAVPPIVAGYFCVFAYSLYANVEQFYKKTVGMAIATTISAIVNVALNYIFIPKYGYGAAAYTSLVGYFLLFIIHFGIVKRIKKADSYDNKFIIITVLGIFMMMFGMLILYHSLTTRICADVIYVVAGIVILYKYLKKRKCNENTEGN